MCEWLIEYQSSWKKKCYAMGVFESHPCSSNLEPFKRNAAGPWWPRNVFTDGSVFACRMSAASLSASWKSKSWKQKPLCFSFYMLICQYSPLLVNVLNWKRRNFRTSRVLEKSKNKYEKFFSAPKPQLKTIYSIFAWIIF